MAIEQQPPVFLLGVLSSPLVGALNRLLNEQTWARERLVPFAGEILEVAIGFLPGLRLRVVEDGTLGAGPVDEAPAVRITVGPASLSAVVSGRGVADAFAVAEQRPGSAAFAAELRFLSRHLRWDAEESLSRLVGDVAAHRAADAARRLAAWPREAATRLSENVADYALEEQGLLARRSELQAMSSELAALHDSLARLEDRLSRLH